MKNKSENIEKIDNQREVFVTAEANANRFNIRCTWILIALAIASVLLNEVGLFGVQRSVMIMSMTAGTVFLLVPCLTQIVIDHILKKSTPCAESRRFKYLILASVYGGIAFVGITLSFHAILLLAIPPLMAAQYRFNRKLNVIVTVATLLLVPITVYGSFFFGLADRNFIKDKIPYEEALNLKNRLKIATPQRMFDIFSHYVVPRLLGILAVEALVTGINRRNTRMLHMQSSLMKSLSKEMNSRNEMQRRVIEDMAGIIETRDVSTGEHIVRTKIYVSIIARAMQRHDEYKDVLTDRIIEQLVQASPMHDIGKIAISDKILLKPGRFTPEEYEEMKKHADKGGEMIRHIFASFDDKEFLDRAYEIAQFHHEKWDGTGYPNGLKGEEIPLGARIMAIADVFDALVSERVYKDPIPPEKAYEIIREGAGSHFDPHIVEILEEVKDDFIAAAKETNVRA